MLMKSASMGGYVLDVEVGECIHGGLCSRCGEGLMLMKSASMGGYILDVEEEKMFIVGGETSRRGTISNGVEKHRCPSREDHSAFISNYISTTAAAITNNNNTDYYTSRRLAYVRIMPSAENSAPPLPKGVDCKVFGIKQCDSMKKAFAWLDKSRVKYEFHDYKKAGVEEAILAAAVAKFGWESVVNKRGKPGWRRPFSPPPWRSSVGRVL